ncbi:hypothetical protein [Pedosphaera parvula]|uniref:hypothetical protein n=1 Tax=Pedosphaera parvula TaxID=1032527 RepID=UPI0002F6B547|nr:hypothetical protein [Pedosphaera parvula]
MKKIPIAIITSMIVNAVDPRGECEHGAAPGLTVPGETALLLNSFKFVLILI